MNALWLAAALAAQPTAESCTVLIPDGDGYRSEPYAALDLAAPGPLPRPPESAAAVICERLSIVPGQNDDRIPVELRLPLIIRAGDRTGVLELHDGQFVFGIVGEEPAAAEADTLSD